MGGAASAGGGPVVFVSYSREDDQWRRRFTEMLKPLVRERRLEVWTDDRELVGYAWRQQLAEAIARSRAALLLVSPDFLASDFIMDQELPALIGHSVLLVPVLVRPCLWQAVPVLEGVQWAHDPGRDGPVANSRDKEGQIVRVCLKLRDLLSGDDAAPGAAGDGASPPVGKAVPLAAGQQPGELHGVPVLPRALVTREELAGVRAAVLRGGDGLVGVTEAALGLHGQGGIGKSVLAAALARDPVVRSCFPDGVFWVTVGERGDLVAAQIGLLDQLGAAHPELRSASHGVGLLRQALADRRCLVVVDDVWSTAAAAAFRAVGPAGRVLYTTRDPAVLEGVGAAVVPVGVLPRDAARELLARLTGVQVQDLPAEADRVCAATAGVALAVALVGAAIGAGGRSWAQAAAQLERGGGRFLDHPYANTFKAMQVGVAGLGEDDALAYGSMAVYPEDTIIPVAAVGRLWSQLWSASADETAARLARLTARSLLTVDGDGVSFHDLQREFLLLYTEDLSLAHADLLAAYQALLPPGATSWARLPPDEPYILDNLVYHMRGAGEGPAIRVLVCDTAYIALRCFLAGPYAAESDLRLAAALFPEDEAIGWLLRLITQWGHLFTRHLTAGDLAATLVSRVHDAPAPVDTAGLTALLPPCYLAPRWGLPVAQPGLARVLEGHVGGVNCVAFSPDGQLLASAGHDGIVGLWNPGTGQLTGALQGHAFGIRSVAFSPDGRLLASAGIDAAVQLWDPATGEPAATFKGHGGGVSSVAFSPDGRLLASAGDDATVRLWDPTTGQPGAILQGHTGWVRSVAFSPDGRLLASAGRDGTVRLWDAATGEPAATLKGHGGVSSVAFSPDGRLLASAGYDATVRLWDPAAGQPGAILQGHTGWVSSVAFSPDGQRLASVGDDATVRLWDPASGEPATTLKGHGGGVSSVTFSPDGRLLASAGDDGTVRLWDPAVGQPGAISHGHTFGVRSVAFSPDGRLLASAGDDATVRLWDPATGQPGAILHGHTGWVNSVAFSLDGRLLASAGDDATVRLWDPATGQPGTILHGHTFGVRSVAFSPDGRLLASAGHDATVRLWDPATGQPGAILHGHSDWVNSLAFSTDGLLASAGSDSKVRLWNPGTGQSGGVLHGGHIRHGHALGVRSVAFSPDGRLLASAGHDGSIRLWDPATFRLSATLHGHIGRVTGVAFSPDGRLLASAGDDGTVRLWDARRPAPVFQLKTGVPVTALTWGPRGITVAGYETLLHLAVIDRTISVRDS